MNRVLVLSIFALVSSSCAEKYQLLTKRSFSQTFQCEPHNVAVFEKYSGWGARGCGIEAYCYAPEGPCERIYSQGEQLENARQTFAKTFSCSMRDIDVGNNVDGLFAEGCGIYSKCERAGFACFKKEKPLTPQQHAMNSFSQLFGCEKTQVAVGFDENGMFAEGCGVYALCTNGGRSCVKGNKPLPPTCESLAAGRYDNCVGRSRAEKSGRSYWGRAAVVAGVITDTIAQNKQVEACRAQYDAEVVACEKQAGRKK